MEKTCAQRMKRVCYDPPEMAVVPGPEPPAPPRPQTDFADGGTLDALVRQELQRVLSSPEFSSSKLCQGFLKYVVENALDGHTENLKERVIGIEVFGKPTSYYTSEDAGVRVKAGEVRKRLHSYYRSGPVDAQILIDLPTGTYVPEFRHLKREEQLVTAKRPSRTTLVLVGGSIFLVGLVAATFFWSSRHRASASIDQFWSPLFQSHQPIFVCTAPVPVYSPAASADSDPPTRLEDFRLVPNRFVAVSDVNSAAQIAEMLGRMGQPYKLRIGNDVSFRDMRTAPAVLVGFSYTQWHEIGEHFRYSIDLSRRPFGVSQDGAPHGLDYQDPPGRSRAARGLRDSLPCPLSRDEQHHC